MWQWVDSSNFTHFEEEVKLWQVPESCRKADTFQYNASAYRVPEGSTIEEALVKRLPGAEVSVMEPLRLMVRKLRRFLLMEERSSWWAIPRPLKESPNFYLQTN